MKQSEDRLCEIFAERVKDAPDFAIWILNQTKFAAFANSARLLHAEQISIRPRKRWWRHWWCNTSGLQKTGKETDIFMVFEINGAGSPRFALHFENKLDNYHFSEGQAADYEIRARYMVGKADYLTHSDFATILLATRSFTTRFPEECDLFDLCISYEEISAFIPEFDQSTK